MEKQMGSHSKTFGETISTSQQQTFNNILRDCDEQGVGRTNGFKATILTPSVRHHVGHYTLV